MGALDGITGDQALQILREAVGEDGGDAAQDQEMEGRILEKVKAVYELLAQEIETLKEAYSHLEKIVMDEIIGGITNLYKENQRGLSIQELKDKLAGEFDGYEGGFSKAFPNEDMWGTLHDKLSEMEGMGSGDDGSSFDKIGKGKEIIGLIKKHLDEIKNALPAGAELKGDLQVEAPVEDSGISPSEVDSIKKMVKSGRFARG